MSQRPILSARRSGRDAASSTGTAAAVALRVLLARRGNTCVGEAVMGGTARPARALQLIMDPTRFQQNVSMLELQRTITRFKIQKCLVTCRNMLHNQWNIFYSVTGTGNPCVLQKHPNNMITKFTIVAQECKEFNVQLGSFKIHNLDDYPKKK